MREPKRVKCKPRCEPGFVFLKDDVIILKVYKASSVLYIDVVANALKRMRYLKTILTLLILTTGTVFSQEYRLTDFVETKLPKVGSDEWFELNHSRNEFKVSVTNGKINIAKAEDPIKGTFSTLEIENGQLIGSDHGEWGGKLEFIPTGTNDKKLIKEGNVKFVFRFKNEIYFIEGLAHLSTDTGTMYRLDSINDNFVVVKLIEFEDAPAAMEILGDSIFIASHQGFFVINDLNKEKIFESTFWSGLYPNSVVVIDNKNIYIGHRGGFTKLDIINKDIQFFKFKTKIR